ncbi:MAG: SDR family oxidoreductase [Lentisphaeria bacterium]|nr:SDR family oxidoreductase [Lentisphaeria bacterium]
MKLEGKKVVITGGAKRVGRAIVKAFAGKGARVVIHCHHSADEAQELLEEIGGWQAGHSIWYCDLSDLSAIKESALPYLADASVLVNNASVFARRTMLEENEIDAATQFAVNYTAPVALMKLFAGICTHPAAVINLLDQGICRPDETSFSYGLSKKLLADATRTAALQLAPEIRVNGIAPGPVLPPVEMPESKMEKTLRSVPLQRAVDLDDLCSGALFLAENESVTGTFLFIDCGQSLCQVPR